MSEAIEIRTADPDLGFAIALWLADLLDEFRQTNPSGTVIIDDGGLAGRPFRNGHLNWTEDFRASREGGHVHFQCSSSSIMLPSRWFAEIARKTLVRLRLAGDSVPLDHLQVVLHQQRIRRLAQSALGVAGRPKPCRFLLRVDDFPSPFADLDEFSRFHQIAVEHGVPYLLAVTPFLESNGERRPLSVPAVGRLHACTSEGAELALHGFSHKSRYSNYGSELQSMPVAALRAELDRADEYLRAHDLKTVGFVAPYNTYDALTIGVLAERFPLICGGPESVVALGYRAGPSFLLRSLYVPSYRDAYDVDLDRLSRFDRLIAEGDGLTIPVTLHWANDVRGDFRAFRALCERLQGHTLRWGDFISGAEAVKSLYRPQ
jgi:peptidoglycan/xylan/chitin deacetylase (PgdA/CDA1 family)